MRIQIEKTRPDQSHRAGRALLSQLYREATGLKLPALEVTERGKPYIPGEDWHFSITHTPRHTLCVLARTPVGIDAEEMDRQIDLRLADKILSPGEKAQYDRAEDKRRALLTFWVLKEAQAKATGEGLRVYPDHTDFSLADPRVQEMDGCLVAVIETEDKEKQYAL